MTSQSLVTRIVLFTLFVNIMAGMLTTPSITGWNVTNIYGTQNKTELINNNQDLSGITPQNANDSASVQTTSDSTFGSIFDTIESIITFRWAKNLFDWFKKYLFGLIPIIVHIFPFTPEAGEVFSAYMSMILGILYTFAIINFILGKRVQ